METGETDSVGMTDINRLKNEARRYEQREQWPRAIELYSKAIDAIEEQGYGSDLSLYNRVGDLYLRQGDTARAVSFYERAVDRYAEQGLQTSAVALCNKVLRIAPGRTELYRTLGRLHAETGLHSQARRSFMEYASRMEKAGEIGAAAEALDEFVKLSADEEARATLGRFLVELDRVPEGLAHLRQVLAERSARGEESGEIEALIQQVAPMDSDQESEDHAGVHHHAEAVSPSAEEEPVPVLSDVEVAELDQIIADLGDLGVGDDAEDPAAVATVEPGELAESTLGASITVQDSTLHDLLNEFQETVVSTVDDTDSAVHYDLGIAYREMGLLDDAIREFTTAIQNDRQLLGAHQQLTESLIQIGQYEAGVGAMAEYVRAVEPDSDPSGQMERMSELLRASPSDETLSELKQLLRSMSDPAASAGANGVAEPSPHRIDIDELFPDLEQAWESTRAGDSVQIEELDPSDGSRPEGSPDSDVEAIEAQAAPQASTETAEELESELDAGAAQIETEDAPPAVPEDDWRSEVATLEESGEPEASFESLEAAEPESASFESLTEAEPESAEMRAEDVPAADDDGNALEALSEALGESLESWSDPDEYRPAWDPESFADDDGAASRASWEPEPSWEVETAHQSDDEQPEMAVEAEPEAASEADVSEVEEPEMTVEAELPDEGEPEAALELAVPGDAEREATLESDVSDGEEPEMALEAELPDEEEPEMAFEAEQPDEEEPEIVPESEESDGDLEGILFGARLATFRARMARSASETDFQAHYDLGLAYKEVALFDEAIAELLVAVTGPDGLARKSLRLMSDVANLAADESLHFTVSQSLHEHGMSAEALEHLARIHDDRLAGGGDADDVLRRMRAIDPHYVPPSADESPATPPAVSDGTEHKGVEVEHAEPAGVAPEDMAIVNAGFDSILEELRVADAGSDAESPEVDEADLLDEVDAQDGEDAGSDHGDLSAWEQRTAGLLEDGHRDEAIRELYRLQAAYEARGDLAGAMRAVANLLLLDPEDIILHHQQVEYAGLLDDQAALARANLELGRCLQRQGASANARATFEGVLVIDPGNESARAALGELHEEEVGEDGTEDDAPRAIADLDPVHYETHYELGVAFKKDGLHDEAVYELEIAARGLDDPMPAYELLGELFNEAGQHQTTSRVLGRALEANSGDDSELAGVLYQLGISYQELGEIDRAAECFRRVFEVDNDYRQVAHRLDQCSL